MILKLGDSIRDIFTIFLKIIQYIIWCISEILFWYQWQTAL